MAVQPSIKSLVITYFAGSETLVSVNRLWQMCRKFECSRTNPHSQRLEWATSARSLWSKGAVWWNDLRVFLLAYDLELSTLRWCRPYRPIPSSMPFDAWLVEGVNRKSYAAIVVPISQEQNVSLEKNCNVLTLNLFTVNCDKEASLGNSTLQPPVIWAGSGSDSYDRYGKSCRRCCRNRASPTKDWRR